MSTLITHIEALNFISIPVSIQSTLNGSNIANCHQNCFNYQSLNAGAVLIHGWAKKHYHDGSVGYVLHTIIQHKLQFIDPPPWLIPSMSGEFAIDESIVWNQENSKNWEFSTKGFGILPQEVK